MLKLNASYSKKVPAESEYSSQSYHCTIEVELPDGLTQQQLQEKVHDVFGFVRSSVENELHTSHQNGNQLPPVQQIQPETTQMQNNGYQQNCSPQQQNYQKKQYQNTNAKATPKQVNYLLTLIKNAGMTVQQILQRCQVASVEQLSSKACSQLIQELSASAA